eukprot:6698672-Pyramimonas_sp.AAC.1
MLAQAKAAQEEGAREEVTDQLALVRAELDAVVRSESFMERTLAALRAQEAPPECPLCLEATEWGAAVITHCGHVYCNLCAATLAAKHGKCATCRGDLRAGEWSVLTQQRMSSRYRQDSESLLLILGRLHRREPMAYLVHPPSSKKTENGLGSYSTAQGVVFY